jgi:hypothetical protein
LLRHLLVWLHMHAPTRRDPRDPSSVQFAILVIGWWIALAGLVTLLLASPVVSAPRTAFQPVPSSRAHLKQPGMRSWPIPTSRLAFDAATRGFAESDEDAIEFAFTVSEWIEVTDRTGVRIVAVDGEAVQIEILDGPWAGRQGWVKPRHLGP